MSDKLFVVTISWMTQPGSMQLLYSDDDRAIQDHDAAVAFMENAKFSSSVITLRDDHGTTVSIRQGMLGLVAVQSLQKHGAGMVELKLNGLLSEDLLHRRVASDPRLMHLRQLMQN